MSDEIRFSVLALYAQVALIDAQNPNAYPEWTTGEERVIFGTHGIAVSTAPDTNIEVIIMNDGEPQKEELSLCASGVMDVGKGGLLVGNIAAADVYEVPWPEGKVLAKVYANNDVPHRATKIVFVLDRV